MGRNKTQKSGIATRRIKDLLEFHVGMLTTPRRTFFSYWDEGYYLEQDINPKNEDDYVKLGYTLDKRFLTRSYNFEIITAMNDIDFADSFNLKIKFTGFPHIQATYFKSVKGEGVSANEYYADLYNKNDALMTKLMKIAKTVDIGHIKIFYRKDTKVAKIKIAPYAGAMLHLVFPPLFMKMPLKQEEIDALWEAMLLLRKHTQKVSIKK